MGKALKVVMFSNHGCMRVHRLAMVLMDRGYKVHLVSNKLTQFSELYETVLIYQNSRQMRDSVKFHADADIFHCHNEPSWYVTLIKEQFPNKPVVLDVHDSLLLRRTNEECDAAQAKGDHAIFNVSADERNNLQLADGLVYVNDRMQKICNETFKLTQPNIVLESMVPNGFYRVDFFQWLGGLVYEGRIDIPDELKREWNFFQYANYLDLAKKCQELGIDFHVYTPRQNAKLRRIYDKECILHEPQPYDKLIRCIGQHDWGLVGNINKHEEWKNALPNKLFDYIAGCTPIVCINAEYSWNFIKDTGMGIKVDSLEELTERWAEHRVCRQNVIKKRKEFTLEYTVGRVEELYQKLLG